MNIGPSSYSYAGYSAAEFLAMTEPKSQPADDAPEDEQPEPANAPVEEPPPPEDDASTSPVTEGEGL